ncbi:hypothetical protein CXX84_17405 [Arthrobacter sp. AFG7.2]|nr:hypothetical protein CXX84_17405 [Arthrobacter sp. AFG7.2]
MPVGSCKSKWPRRRLLIVCISTAIAVIAGLVCVLWIAGRASTIRTELEAATRLLPEIKVELQGNNAPQAAVIVEDVKAHTALAKEAASDPVWVMTSVVPGIGPNLSAVGEVARSADDVATLALAPLADVAQSLEWDKLLPSSSGTNVAALAAASPSVTSAAHAVQASADRLHRIDESTLLPQVQEPLRQAREQLREVTGALNAAADASRVLPAMLGGEESRSYLLIIQNNAEVRASGGIPGALAVLNLNQGKLTLGEQSSASDIGVMVPVVPVDRSQQQIYSGRLGKFMQDVNLTPDFPSAAQAAEAMWERKTGQQVDGVLSVDPVALSYILQATGPVKLDEPDGNVIGTAGLPTELTSENLVQTLLSDVYSHIEQPDLQDAYFASVAERVFESLADGRSEPATLITGITRGTNEGRVLVWSGTAREQAILANYPVSGSVGGPSVAPAEFGAYFNDGTGAKMDYYVKRTVQLIKECPRDGYEQITLRVTSINTAPADAATSLPTYVTGAGNFGVPPGSVQTNIVAYGPVQAQVETAKLDGQKTEFAPYFHSNRPVGILAIRLAPGESRTVDFTFGKIVQHTEPNVVVTPTVQDVKDVTLPTETVPCG